MVVGGHDYVIYTDGQIEGFGEGAIVFNYFPPLLDLDRVQRSLSLAKGISSAPEDPTSNLTSDLTGAGHSAPA